MRTRNPLTLSPGASFATAALVAGLSLWSSAAPTVVYPLYARDWQIDATVTTAIFATYPIVLIPVLVIFGNLSDVVGRRGSILLGLAALAVGTLAFALAPSLPWVFVGRAFQGLGVGLALSPATAAMIEFGGPTRAHRASSTTTAATAGGLALATLVGGALVQYAAAPLHLTFWVLLAATVVTAALVWFLPRRTPAQAASHWRPRTLRVPREIRLPFVAGTLGISGAYALGAIFLALGAQIAHDLVQSDNVLIDGAVISVSAIMIGVVAVLTRRLAPRIAVSIGPAFTLVGLLLLVLAGLQQSLLLFLASSVVAGTGYALLFSGGLGLIAAAAPEQHRGAALSLAYVVGYALQAAAALGLGALATRAGLQTALEVGTPLITAIGVGAAVVANLRRRPTAVTPSAEVAAVS